MRLRDSCSCGATIDVEDRSVLGAIHLRDAHDRFLASHAACRIAPEPPRRYVDPPPAKPDPALLLDELGV